MIALIQLLPSVALAFVMSYETHTVARYSGTWTRNAEQSDDPREVLSGLRGQMGRPEEGGPGGPRGGGMGPRGDGMPPGGGGRGRGPHGGGGPPFGEALRRLEIAETADELKVTAGETVRIYYLDGKKHVREEPNGAKLEITALRKGETIEVAQKGGSFEVNETYEISPDGKTLVVTRRMKSERVKEPVVLRTVYDREVKESESVEGVSSRGPGLGARLD